MLFCRCRSLHFLLLLGCWLRFVLLSICNCCRLRLLRFAALLLLLAAGCLLFSRFLLLWLLPCISCRLALLAFLLLLGLLLCCCFLAVRCRRCFLLALLCCPTIAEQVFKLAASGVCSCHPLLPAVAALLERIHVAAAEGRRGREEKSTAFQVCQC